MHICLMRCHKIYYPRHGTWDIFITATYVYQKYMLFKYHFVPGDAESNKKACQFILFKIEEDPQSGSCLNVSYADITGPVANFSPTGSPFAHSSASQHFSSNSPSTLPCKYFTTNSHINIESKLNVHAISDTVEKLCFVHTQGIFHIFIKCGTFLPLFFPIIPNIHVIN